jgi:hypothetical protein
MFLKDFSIYLYMNTFQVVCIEEDYFTPVELGKVYTVTDIIEAGSSEETYILEEKHPDGDTMFEGMLVYSDQFITLDEWRERQLNKIGL